MVAISPKGIAEDISRTAASNADLISCFMLVIILKLILYRKNNPLKEAKQDWSEVVVFIVDNNFFRLLACMHNAKEGFILSKRCILIGLLQNNYIN